ncbi:hypothetical protein RDI58_008687 [Solanum bulbocastanum]|uniref:KIB1-4 beta-propeller domain-containing protein n=1 Tax=Solanum bulbocastanum TaxID=147425 RepID=A0AAN8YIS9_SOLBU
MVIEGNINFVSFWRPGDLRWTRIESSPSVHCDIVYFNGKFYAVDWAGRVLAYDVIQSGPTQIVAQLQLPSKYIYRSRVVHCRITRITICSCEMWCSGWVKYNTDGASRGNPGVSSYAFCLRDDRGDIIYAEGATIESTTSTVAEAKAILEASKHYIGDRALFLGANASRSVQASQFPGLKPNRIYFTNDYCESYLAYVQGGGLDMGIFNLGDGTIQPHNDRVSLSPVCPPTWVTPTLN